MLRQTKVELARGKRIGEVCRSLGISEQSYYRWRSEYGAGQTDPERGVACGKLLSLNADASVSRTCSSSWAFRSGGRPHDWPAALNPTQASGGAGGRSGSDHGHRQAGQ
jgi:hypothetical protein